MTTTSIANLLIMYRMRTDDINHDLLRILIPPQLLFTRFNLGPHYIMSGVPPHQGVWLFIILYSEALRNSTLLK